MTDAEKIAALEAAREKLDDMIITTAKLYTAFDSAEAAPIGHISALYQDRGAIDDMLYELREARDPSPSGRLWKKVEEAVQ